MFRNSQFRPSIIPTPANHELSLTENSEEIDRNAKDQTEDLVMQELYSVEYEELKGTQKEKISEVILLKSGKVLTRQLSKDGSVLFKIWDLTLKGEERCVLTKELKNPTGKEIDRYYLPEGPILVEMKDEAILDSYTEFRYREAQTEVSLNRVSGLPAGQTPCFLGVNECALLKLTSRGYYSLNTYNKVGVSWGVASTLELPKYQFQKNDGPILICSMSQNLLCISNNQELDLWYRDKNGPFSLKDNIQLADVDKKSYKKLKFSGLTAISEQEVIFYVDYRGMEEKAIRDQDYLVKVNIENRSISTLSCGYADASTSQAVGLSIFPPLFFVRTNLDNVDLNPVNRYLFDANGMTLKKIPLEANDNLIAQTARGDLFITTKTGFKLIRSKELNKYIEQIDEALRLPVMDCLGVRPLADIVTAYVGRDTILGSNFSSFFKKNEKPVEADKPVLFIKEEKSRICVLM